jgi:hypothetical protein
MLASQGTASNIFGALMDPPYLLSAGVAGMVRPLAEIACPVDRSHFSKG